MNSQTDFCTDCLISVSLFCFARPSPLCPSAGAASTGEHFQHMHWTGDPLLPPYCAAVPSHPRTF